MKLSGKHIKLGCFYWYTSSIWALLIWLFFYVVCRYATIATCVFSLVVNSCTRSAILYLKKQIWWYRPSMNLCKHVFTICSLTVIINSELISKAEGGCKSYAWTTIESWVCLWWSLHNDEGSGFNFSLHSLFFFLQMIIWLLGGGQKDC